MRKPSLLLIKSYAIHCNHCNRHCGRAAQFVIYDHLGNDWRCPSCGCTSVKLSEGRPYGRKSRDYHWIYPLFADLYPVMRKEDGWLDQFVFVTEAQL